MTNSISMGELCALMMQRKLDSELFTKWVETHYGLPDIHGSAELVHWAIPTITPAFALWNPPLLSAAMAAYAVAANAPCIAVQRYNRARIARVLRRRATGARG